VKPQRIYVAFQGGGAKGIAHVGAYHALSALTLPRSAASATKLQIAGVAGTSAGAIIAALVAAKYRPNNLFDPKKQQHLLQRLMAGRYKTPSELFTARGWRKVGWLGAMGRHKWLTIGMLLIALVGSGAFLAYPSATSFWMRLLVLSIIWTVVSIVGYRQLGGLAPLCEIRAMVDSALAASPLRRSDLPAKDITFAQLRDAGGRPLKIVATNITERNVTVFSAERTPHVVVADAVCASICIPVLFSPYKVTVDGVDAYFIDGGPLSNLPLWTFDHERALDPDAWTIGFSLKPTTEAEAKAEVDLPMSSIVSTMIRRSAAAIDLTQRPTPAPTPFSWVKPAAEAVIAGPLEIHARQIADLMVVRIPTWVKLLDFCLPFARYKEQVLQAQRYSERMLRAMASVGALTSLLRDLNRDLSGYLENLAANRSSPSSVRLRFAVLAPRQRSTELLWVAATLNHRRIESSRHTQAVALEGSLPGGVYDRAKTGFSGPRAAGRNAPGGTLMGDSGLVADSAWTIAVPVFNRESEVEPEQVRAVLTIDSASLTIDELCSILGLAPNDLSGAAAVIEYSVVNYLTQVPEFGQIAENLLLWH